MSGAGAGGGGGGWGAIVDEKFCFQAETNLTVHKTSVFFQGDGFIVHDPNGKVMFRFDSYGPDSHPKDELVLMDAHGNCLLTLLRKRPSLHHRWEGYLGERNEDQDPLFCLRRSSIIGRGSLEVHVFGDPGEEYHIEASYTQRCCTIHDASAESSSDEPVAEIQRRVEPPTHVALGKDVFWLCLKPRFDAAFATGLVLVLDQMYGDGDSADEVARDVNANTEDSSP